ncbi:calvin cycle protein CP12-1, chloroplastic-like [Curcuma longa]|uniref:calvin cycle protein CP12-1, chloroplastic-like n=1 Tax=Curcuma longa TaxID=136217 RepID=UPI003D9DC969
MAATSFPGAVNGLVSAKARLSEPLRGGSRSLLVLYPRGSSGLPRGAALVASVTPLELSEKVAESIKNAEETCAGDAASGECAAAWDEVEELSAAASHARDKLKANSDPLENYCKDNPEADECRAYED